jgi:7,8-dihydropterin-6-yl-methyl-4-(beta-D-ribofuranosyl)aminobenzene 5'-phosphate synthase
LNIITECSHSGICNIVEHAREVCRKNRVLDIIGGFHLLGLKKDDPGLTGVWRYFQELNPPRIHPCHCTDLQSKLALSWVYDVQKVVCRLQLKY